MLLSALLNTDAEGGETMKKIALFLAIILVISAPLTVHAAEPRILSIYPGISFNGTTAECSVTVVGDYTTDEIDVVIKLWRGSTCVKTWYDSGDGYIFWEGTATAVKGKTYTLTADVTINNVTKPRVSVSGTC